MNASGMSKLRIVAGIVILNLLVAVILYFAVFPLAIPGDTKLAPSEVNEFLFNLTLAGFILSTLFFIAAALAIWYVMSQNGGFQEAADAIRQPLILLDENNRYLAFNREAEKMLSLSRERDLGRSLDAAIQGALAARIGEEGFFSTKAVIERNSIKYQVFDNPFPMRDGGMMNKRRIITFREVTNLYRIREAVREINKTMLILNANAAKISSSAASLSQGTTRQAGSLSAITTSLDEFSKKIQGNTESAAKSTQLAAQAREAAERSGNEIAHALTAMTDVQDAGIRIARIVKLIDDIAFQTNLLALNAAVEAARAGRQGKGFAVVADEVRNLAGRSAKAAKDTASMVEDVTERIGNASNYISKLEEMLRNIVHDAIRMADSSASSSATSTEQASAILQVNRELGQISSMTSGTQSSAEETATAVEVLARQVDMLKQRLDGLGRELSLASDDSDPSRINLLDEPETPYPAQGSRPYLANAYSSRAHDYGSDDYLNGGDRDDEAPFRKTAGSAWNLDADMDNNDDPLDSLANLLRSDGYEDNYRDFLNSVTKGKRPGAGEPTEYDTSPEGDRVVKPGQNIQLDDAEFGRY